MAMVTLMVVGSRKNKLETQFKWGREDNCAEGSANPLLSCNPDLQINFRDYLQGVVSFYKEYSMAKSKIHIKKSHEGSFTAKAKRAGMSVQAYAAKVLAKGSKASAATKKQANFARNASKWHRKKK